MTDNKVVQLGTIRATRNNDASAWAPREILVEMIRMMDAGEVHPDKMIVCYDGVDGTNFLCATGSMLDTVGLLQVTQLSVYNSCLAASEQ